MSLDRLSYRYAKSLLDLSLEKKKLEEVFSDMKMLENTIKKNPDLRVMLKSPIINPEKKRKILDTIFRARIEDMTLKFLNILAIKGRENYLPEIVTAFIAQYNFYNNITPVEITTAVPLNDEALEAMKRELKRKFKLQNVEVKTKVDESIIGGFVARYDDKLIDASVGNKLEQLKKEFSQNKFVKQL